MRILIFAALLSGCATTQIDSARQMLTALETVAKGAVGALDAVDHERQGANGSIVREAIAACVADPAPAACTSRVGGAKLDAYLKAHDIAEKAIRALAAALAVSEAGVAVADLAAQPFDFAALASALLPAVRAVLGALRDLGVAPGVLAAIGAVLP